MTVSQSLSSMLKIVLSRRIPALFTRMSQAPKLEIAVWKMARPPAMVATES